MTKIILVVIASTLALIGNIPYLRDVIKGKVQGFSVEFMAKIHSIIDSSELMMMNSSITSVTY